MAFQLRWSGSGSWAACGPSNQGPRTSSDECFPWAISEVFSLLPHADAKWVKSMRTTSWRQRIPPNYWGDQYFKIEIGLLNVHVSTRKILTACNQQSTFLWESNFAARSWPAVDIGWVTWVELCLLAAAPLLLLHLVPIHKIVQHLFLATLVAIHFTPVSQWVIVLD